jgi:mono/diheme cytochrome c family protein
LPLVRLAAVRRAAVIAVVGALLAGCGGSETTAPTAETVETGGGGGQPQPPAPMEGDPEAGKQVYAANGCGSCHTFGPAGSSGTTGPNLDQLAEFAENADRGTLEEFTRESIVSPDAYVEEGFPSGVMPASQLEEKQLNDLVAFLTQS